MGKAFALFVYAARASNPEETFACEVKIKGRELKRYARMALIRQRNLAKIPKSAFVTKPVTPLQPAWLVWACIGYLVIISGIIVYGMVVDPKTVARYAIAIAVTTLCWVVQVKLILNWKKKRALQIQAA